MKEAVFYQALMSGNTMVDDQHKQLIDAINKLYRAIESGTGVEEAKKTLDFLAEYTTFHFGCEEALMKSKKFPLYTQHKKVHDAFIETVNGLYEVLGKKGANEEFEQIVEKEVTDWLINHIQGMDMQMTDWIKVRTNGMMDNLL